MKRNHRKSGFTLLELLAVIVIVGILVGIVIGVAGNVRQKAAKSRAITEISAIELAIERYKIDNGIYPDTDASTIDIPTASGEYYSGAPSDYIASGEILFAALCGREKFTDDIADGETQYFEVKESQVTTTDDASYLTDPFGYAYGYVYDASEPVKSYYNQVMPDIWSTAGNSTANISSANEEIYLRWVTNWGSN